jgi:hypothetical protein
MGNVRGHGGSRVFLACLTALLLIKDAASQEIELEALQLAIEQNGEHRHFVRKCFLDWIRTDVFLVPIDEVILEAAVAYKAAISGMSSDDAADLREANLDRYLQGDDATFALLVRNSKGRRRFDPYDHVQFEDFANDVVLRAGNRRWRLRDYTRIFDAPLSPGWNRGYLYFENFRLTGSYDYSVHFSRFDVTASTRHCPKPTNEWAMSFDESDLGILALLQKGMSSREIRRNHGISGFQTAGLSGSDMMGFVQVLLGLLMFIK